MPLSFRQVGNLFVAGPNITIYPSGNSIAFSGSATGTSVGIESISTIGSGAYSIASSVTNNNLVYKSLLGGSNFSITETTNGTLIFTSSTPNFIQSGTNVGTGTGIFCGLTTTNTTNDTLAFRNFSGGNEVGIIINDNNEIVISRGKTVVNTISNQGGGARIFSAITGNSIVQMTIISANTSGFTAGLAGTGNVNVNITPTNTTLDRFYTTTTGPVLNASTNFTTSAATGSMGISATSVSNTRLLIQSGTGAISQIRLTPFATEPTTPSDGSIWYSTSGNTLKLERGTNPSDFLFVDNNISLTGATSALFVNTAGTITRQYLNSFGIFNTISSLTISDTAAESSLISTNLVGSTTLFSSTNQYNPELITGRKFRFNAKGIINTGDNVNLTIRIKLGSITISSSSTISVGPIGSSYTSEIEIETTFTVRNSGIVIGSGKIIFLTNPPSGTSGDPIIFGIYSQNQTITTTSDQVFDCTAQFDIQDPSNNITITESTLEILN